MDNPSESTPQILSAEEVTKLLKLARMQHNSKDLFTLVRNMRSSSVPKCYYLQVFDVLHDRLGLHTTMISKGPETCKRIMASIEGLVALGVDYFSQHEDHLLQCWPRVFDWLKALFHAPNLKPENEKHVLRAVRGFFDVAAFVRKDLFDNDEMLEFAIDLWVGFQRRSGSERDQYLVIPLRWCMEADSNYSKRFFRILGEDLPVLLVLLVGRFSVAASSKSDIDAAMDLSELLKLLWERGQKIVRETLQKSNSIPILTTGVHSLLKVTERTKERDYAVHCILQVISALPFNSDCIEKTIRAGILNVLLEVAANDSYFACQAAWIRILGNLQPALVHPTITSEVVEAMTELSSSRRNETARLLRSASLEFRSAWHRFESSLLEQAVMFELFDKGYASELGYCATCRRSADRSQFRKCAGCLFVLYCSRSCANLDWDRHRMYCGTRSHAKNGRLLRRQATIHVQRNWSGIMSAAERDGIPFDRVGVHLVRDTIPFRIEVFDCCDVASIPDCDPLAMYEVGRGRDEGLPCVLLIISYVEKKKKYMYSEMIYMDSWFGSNPYLRKRSMADSKLGGPSLCVKDGEYMYASPDDMIKRIVFRTLCLIDHDWMKVWADKPYKSLIEKAMTAPEEKK